MQELTRIIVAVNAKTGEMEWYDTNCDEIKFKELANKALKEDLSLTELVEEETDYFINFIDSVVTVVVGGDEEEEDIEEDEVPDELYLCDECDEMYYDEMSTGECCDGATFRVVDKGDMGFH